VGTVKKKIRARESSKKKTNMVLGTKRKKGPIRLKNTTRKENGELDLLGS